VSNIVYVGTSLDGYIADRDGGLDWLESVPNPDKDDMGWAEFIDSIDAIVMGRMTMETVLGFGIGWPYEKKVFVLSNSLSTLPDGLNNQVELIKGSPVEITSRLNAEGYKNLYIDGGFTIQSFLKADLIDEMIITRIPILLGGGVSLFGSLPEHLMFEHISTETYLGELVSSRYRRKR
jgi:dihydrofolate reductase